MHAPLLFDLRDGLFLSLFPILPLLILFYYFFFSSQLKYGEKVMPDLANLPVVKINAAPGRLGGTGYSRDAPILRRGASGSDGDAAAAAASSKPQDAASISATSMRYLASRIGWGTSSIMSSGPGVARH